VNSTHDLKVAGSILVQNTRWKWSTFKAMPGSIPAPNSGSFVEKNKKNIGSQMGQTDNKNICCAVIQAVGSRINEETCNPPND
jgi:hypothetical protein